MACMRTCRKGGEVSAFVALEFKTCRGAVSIKVRMVPVSARPEKPPPAPTTYSPVHTHTYAELRREMLALKRQASNLARPSLRIRTSSFSSTFSTTSSSLPPSPSPPMPPTPYPRRRSFEPRTEYDRLLEEEEEEEEGINGDGPIYPVKKSNDGGLSRWRRPGRLLRSLFGCGFWVHS